MDFFDYEWPEGMQVFNPEEKKKLLRIKDNLVYYHDFARPIKRTGKLPFLQKERLKYWDAYIGKFEAST